MRERTSGMDQASEELERRSRYLSSLIERTKFRTEAEEREKKEEEENEKEKEKVEEIKEEGDPHEQQNVKVRAADMSQAMQRKAFRCAREVMKEMNKLDSKRIALALKKVKFFFSLFLPFSRIYVDFFFPSSILSDKLGLR